MFSQAVIQVPARQGKRKQRGKSERKQPLRKDSLPNPRTASLPARRFPFIPGRSPPRTHLLGNTTWQRPRPPRPPPGTGRLRAEGQPSAGATGDAARGRAGGAGRGLPSAAGRSRAAAGSETCRAAPPQPPRPLARRGAEERSRLGAGVGRSHGRRPPDAPPAPRRSAGRPSRATEEAAETGPTTSGRQLEGSRRELEGNRRALRSYKAGATKCGFRRGGETPGTRPSARAGCAPDTRAAAVPKGPQT